MTIQNKIILKFLKKFPNDYDIQIAEKIKAKHYELFPGKLSTLRRRINVCRQDFGIFPELVDVKEYHSYVHSTAKKFPEDSYRDLAQKIALKYPFKPGKIYQDVYNYYHNQLSTNDNSNTRTRIKRSIQ